MTTTATPKTLAQQYAESAEFYRQHAGTFEPGSLGYLGNMAEATKYAGLATQQTFIEARS